ncbi:MAG: hypothetical protein M0Z31_10225 [Clostridia bacterium]|nr:hypothetical protein [Clostridia bacterium]
MTEDNKAIQDQDNRETGEEAARVKGLLGKNKAAALGLAVLLATGTLLTGCGGPERESAGAQWEVVEDEEEDEEANTFYHGGYFAAGYFLRSGRPVIDLDGKVKWSKPKGKYKSGGYGAIRGGSAIS